MQTSIAQYSGKEKKSKSKRLIPSFKFKTEEKGATYQIITPAIPKLPKAAAFFKFL